MEAKDPNRASNDLSLEMLTQQTTYREALTTYRFLIDLLWPYWKKNWPDRIEVSTPEVDDAGYDLIMEACGITRHVQLKSSYAKARTRKQSVHIELAKKKSGCVIWIVFDQNLKLTEFLWFGCAPGEPLRSLDEYRAARTTRGDASGRKKTRPNFRVVPKGEFTPLKTMKELEEKLFGST